MSKNQYTLLDRASGNWLDWFDTLPEAEEARARLSLADCFLLATASRLGASVATADPAVAAAARDESLELVPLPDRSGRRP